MSSAVDEARAVRQLSRDASNILYRYEGGVRRVMNDISASTVETVDPDTTRSLGVDVDAEFTNELPAGPLPGHGDPYDDCGEEQPLLFCSGCGDPVWIPRRCRRARCPECWESWTKTRAVDMSAKIEARKRYENAKYRAMHGGDGYGTLRHHVTVSPPQDLEMRREGVLNACFETVKLLLEECGADEGAIIYHPYRIDEDHRGAVLGHDSGDGDLQWKDILEMIEEDGFESVREEYLSHEPHFHAFVLSESFHGDTPHIEDKTGWVVHRIEDENGASVRTLADLTSAVAYSLSHSMLRETGRGMDAQYRYYGEVATHEPTDGVRADADHAMRSCASDVLGVPLPDARCTAADIGVQNDGVEIAVGAFDPDATASGEDDDGEEDDSCGRARVPMADAPRFLNDSEWVDGAPRADDLREAFEEFCRLYPVLDDDRPPPDMDLPPTGDGE